MSLPRCINTRIYVRSCQGYFVCQFCDAVVTYEGGTKILRRHNNLGCMVREKLRYI